MIDLAEIQKLQLALERINSIKYNDLTKDLIYTTPYGSTHLKFSDEDILAAQRLTTNNFAQLLFLLNMYLANPKEHIKEK
jgi:hypothetical protein